jgi:ribosomal protein L37E
MPELECPRCGNPTKQTGKTLFCQSCAASLAVRKRRSTWQPHVTVHTVRAAQLHHQAVKPAHVTLPSLAFAHELAIVSTKAGRPDACNVETALTPNMEETHVRGLVST